MSDHEHYEYGLGPVYTVPLIDVLPLNPNKPDGMKQQMPSHNDLKAIIPRHERVAAGYEVLLHHWRCQKGEIARLAAELADIKEKVRYWSHCTSEGMRATCPEQVEDLANFFIDLGIAPWYVRNTHCETVKVVRDSHV